MLKTNKCLYTIVVLAVLLIALVVYVVGFAAPSVQQSEDVGDSGVAFSATTVSSLVHRTAADVSDESLESSNATQTSEPLSTTSKFDADGNAYSYASNSVILTVDADVKQSTVAQAFAAIGIQDVSLSMLSDTAGDGSNIILAEYDGDVDPEYVSAQITTAQSSMVVEPNYISMLADVDSSDSLLAEEGEDCTSDLDETSVDDTYIDKQWGLTSVNASTAWDYGRTSGTVTVAVIDSGVDYDHPDLESNLILGNYAKNSHTGAVGAAAVNDTISHGTHVAGVIAGVSNNSLGISGVSYNAKILPIKAVYDSQGHLTEADIIEAIDYVVQLKTSASSPDYLKNIRVINMSLCGENATSAYKNAVKSAYNAGILICAAAGNSASSATTYPACYENVIGVSGLKQSSSSTYGEIDKSYSNYGKAVDIAAPGTNIYSTVLSGSYGSKTGTSMASPMVAGAAALLFSLNMDATPAEVEKELESTAYDLGDSGWDAYYGYGALDIGKAAYDFSGGTLYHVHAAGEPVITDEVEATCTTAGSYVESTYCMVCGKLMSARTVEVAALGHEWGEWQIVEPASLESCGLQRRVCARDESHVEELVIPRTGTAIVYRLYNSSLGEHLFTTDYNEYTVLTAYGWRQEGVGWTAPQAGVPVYRLYNSSLSAHLYTADMGEATLLTSQYGWSWDNMNTTTGEVQPAFYSAQDTITGIASADAVPVYRLYNGAFAIPQHHFTMDKSEYDALPSRGWSQEGISFYALAS